MSGPTEIASTASLPASVKVKEVEATRKDISADKLLEINEKTEDATQESEETKIHLQGLTEYYSLRKRWSTFLCCLIGILITFHIVLTVFIGRGWFNFADYKVVLGIIVGENFAQIIALALIVVKFLFDPNRKICGKK